MMVTGLHDPVPILLYHSVGRSDSVRFRPFAIDPALFGEHLDALADSGRSIVTIGELLDAAETGAVPDRPIVISFDDGFADFHMAAAPALAERRMRATLYVTTAYLGQTSRWLQRDGEADRKMLTSDQVRDLAADGFEIGAHGHSHAMLDALSTPSARHDIGRSRHILEDVLGSRIRTFAYPHGYSSRRVRRIVQDEGFMAGLGVRHAVSSPADDPYAVSRIVVTGDTSSAGLLSLLDGVGIEISDGRERVATRAWRGWRRSTAIRQRRLAGREAL